MDGAECEQDYLDQMATILAQGDLPIWVQYTAPGHHGVVTFAESLSGEDWKCLMSESFNLRMAATVLMVQACRVKMKQAGLVPLPTVV